MDLPKKILAEYLNFALLTAESAGKILLKYGRKLDSLAVKNKKAEGACSEADLASEDFICGKILRKYPETSILAEEMAYEKKEKNYSRYVQLPQLWVIDPLDGTNNFLNGFDYYSVCISLLHFGTPVMGVIHRPATEEFFYATSKGGSYWRRKNLGLRPKKIFSAENKKKLNETIIVAGSYHPQRQNLLLPSFEDNLRFVGRLSKETRAIRRLGSAALDLSYVAKGVFDGFWESGLRPWDIAAASVICQESGVRITNLMKEDLSIFDGGILAARRPLYDKLNNLLKKG